MSISLRAQILAAAFGLCVPVLWLVSVSSGLTFTENRQYVQAEESRVSALVSARLTDAPEARQRIIAETLATLPPGSRVLVAPAGAVAVYLPENTAWQRTWLIYRRNYIVVISVTLVAVAIVFLLSRRWRRGLRLGLSVSYGIIEPYGGRIGYRRGESGGAILWFDVSSTHATHTTN